MPDFTSKDVDGLFDYIGSVSYHTVSTSGYDEFAAFTAAKRNLILAALDEIVKQDSSPETQNRVLVERIRTLFHFGGNDEYSRQMLQDLLRNNAKHADSRINGIVAAVQLTHEFTKMIRFDQQPSEDLIDRIFEAAYQSNLNPELQSLIKQLEISLRDKKLVLSYLKHKQLELIETEPLIHWGIDVENLRRELRRLTIVGAPIYLAGDTLDGRLFDWAQYRGQYVLVEFWASWCLPSIQRLQMISDFRQANPNSNVAVVGVCLDLDEESVQRAVLKHQFLHVNLFSGSEFERGWKHPIARYYGLTQIPLGLVVAPDGDVMAETATKLELQKRLQQFCTNKSDLSGQAPQAGFSR